MFLFHIMFLYHAIIVFCFDFSFSTKETKLYIPSTLNIDLILWHTQLLLTFKMLNHDLNHVFFLSLFKLISCPIHWIVCVFAYLHLNFIAVLGLPKTAGSAKTHKSMSFIWIVWSTLYVYIWLLCAWAEPAVLGSTLSY